ncbi:hypothetical protein ACJJIE_12770 [Microbulbifer sp. TRSA001]|uniref:hypothetical protein n=1 Tax=Microbulbifer sp. TRSA001 TaxID=3243381 RepID=UPI00403916F3
MQFHQIGLSNKPTILDSNNGSNNSTLSAQIGDTNQNQVFISTTNSAIDYIKKVGADNQVFLIHSVSDNDKVEIIQAGTRHTIDISLISTANNEVIINQLGSSNIKTVNLGGTSSELQLLQEGYINSLNVT